MSSSRLIAAVLLGIPVSTGAAQSYSENHLGVFAGSWMGADFAMQSITVFDSVTGNIEFSSALNQGNSIAVGLQYTGYFTPLFGADITVGYVSNTWTTVGGRFEFGQLIGETTEISGVVTVPMALNAIFRAPTPSSLPRPFLTAGVGGVFYEFSESNAPLRIPPTMGTPIDTVLFDLKLGLRFAPNIGGGVVYGVTDRVGLRLEGRLWSTWITERVADERITQNNKSFLLSATFRL